MVRSATPVAQTFTLSPEHPTGNFWVDMGLVVLLEQCGKQESDQVREWLLSKLVQKTGKMGQYYDKTAGTVREYEKVKDAFQRFTPSSPAPKSITLWSAPESSGSSAKIAVDNT